MRRKIPFTSALTAFEAAARHESLTLAGEELALTHAGAAYARNYEAVSA